MKAKHVLIGILTFAILVITGCSYSIGSVTQSEFPPSMSALVKINGKEYQMEEGNYKWVQKKGSTTQVYQTDHSSPYQMADHIEPISVKPNEKIDIEIEDNPDLKVYTWDENGRGEEVKLDGNQLKVPSSDGTYIYEVEAEWGNGTVSYTFVLEVH
ncbi:hypothetical protein AM500_04695 [Bacillus sp. FJAT-18017]|uniref:hypothetical protein n=1 Tax=Bacillus sp. FJAT-18017 TaxID=1705566 RepID=UPI0006AF5CFD|nr:hypothetical protein [Bacillus sp. FJAT-18017]ALC89167.1 hypothetical protein AM500_04695 [Bacillus sp. FJAT-18017]